MADITEITLGQWRQVSRDNRLLGSRCDNVKQYNKEGLLQSHRCIKSMSHSGKCECGGCGHEWMATSKIMYPGMTRERGRRR